MKPDQSHKMILIFSWKSQYFCHRICAHGSILKPVLRGYHNLWSCLHSVYLLVSLCLSGLARSVLVVSEGWYYVWIRRSSHPACSMAWFAFDKCHCLLTPLFQCVSLAAWLSCSWVFQWKLTIYHREIFYLYFVILTLKCSSLSFYVADVKQRVLQGPVILPVTYKKNQ